MTLKTVTGPSLREALADARRLFGADAVLLQSTPAVAGGAASVTVAFDDEPSSTAAPKRAAAALPDAQATVAPRAYGYGAARNVRPAASEPMSAPPAEPVPFMPPVVMTRPIVSVPVTPAAQLEGGAGTPAEDSAAEVRALRERLASLEAQIARLPIDALPETPPAAPPAPAPAAPALPRPLVLVGAGGSGKTSLALRLAQTPSLVGAERPAVLVVSSDDGHTVDPSPAYGRAGVPTAVVRTADEVREALESFDGADRVLVDTPSLPLDPERAAPFVRQLGETLAPLAAVDVCLVVAATRAPSTLTPTKLVALGLQPDALALTRLDEAEGGAEEDWARWLGLDLRLTSAGRGEGDVSKAEAPAPLPPRPALSEVVVRAVAPPVATPAPCAAQWAEETATSSFDFSRVAAPRPASPADRSVFA